MQNLEMAGCRFDLAGLGLQTIMSDQPKSILGAANEYDAAAKAQPDYPGTGCQFFLYLLGRTFDGEGHCNEWGPTMLAMARKLQEKAS